MTHLYKPRRLVALFVGLLLFVACGQEPDGPSDGARPMPLNAPAPRQFDSWIGQWDVTNRYLQEDESWEDDGTAVDNVYSILDGKAILEFWEGQARQGPLKGFSIRYFDPEKDKWILALNWPSPNQPFFFELDGQFRHGRGEFFRQARDSTGAPLLARYTFSDFTPSSLRWDAAYSRDGGTTWRTNWVMEFTRTAETAPWPDPGTPFPTYDDGSRCTAAQSKAFDALEGRWTGTYEYKQNGTWTTASAQMEGHRVLNGCAVFNITEYEIESGTRKVFQIRSYIPQREQWVTMELDNEPNTNHAYFAGAFDGETVTLKEQRPDTSMTGPRARIAWSELGDRRLAYTRADSTDAGWTPTARVNLERE